MRICLREIISIPEREVPFCFELDVSELSFASVEGFNGPVTAQGTVRNRAGVLTVTGRLTADMNCVCARCLREFERHLDLDISAFLAEELQDEDSEDTYLLDGDWADLGEIAMTTLVLNMDQRFLCREDCKGLCSKCGKDLNDGPCDCRENKDPRLAVLGQLLENKD